MKKSTIISGIILIIAIILLAVSGTMYSKSKRYIPIVQMHVQSSGIKNGIIDPQYGAASHDKLGAMPLESLPLSWSGQPKDTVSYVVEIKDNDTVPVLGFTWIHWLTANIPANITSLPANASTTMANDMTQGLNSYADGVMLNMPSMKGFYVPRKDAAHYGGMVPVGFAHQYTIEVYALNEKLNLQNGYTYNQLAQAMKGHIVGEGTLDGTYNASIVHLPVSEQNPEYVKAHNGQ
ncbi:MAG: YbhB/YbcL family Raf kinase inhibitor-like protein [Sarcina sp.]